MTTDISRSKTNDLESSISENEDKLKKYNRQLSRNLKTLDYIFQMELDSGFLKDSKRSLAILNLKENIQREVIRNTKLINVCKAEIS